MIDEHERAKMLAVDLCGERVIARLESIGVRHLADLDGRDPWEMLHEVNLQAGRPIWRAPMAIVALQNLVDAAEREAEALPRAGAVSVRSGQRASGARKSSASRLTLDNLGFLLAKAGQRWNELLYERFVAAGFSEVRPAYGSLLIPLYEEDGLRQGELARRARLSKQTMTTLARALERDGLIERRIDPTDARATLIFLTKRAQQLRPVAEQVLAELDAHVAKALPARVRTSLKGALRQIAELDRERARAERA